MFKLENLRKETKNGWTYLLCDFNVTETESPFNEKTMWVAVEEQNGDMLSDAVYDSFVLVPLILGMYYKQDVHVCGGISQRLYHNITHYIMNIFDRFSDRTQPVKFTVDKFAKIEDRVSEIIGTGISCGVDSLTTIYDNYVTVENPDFRINGLFFVNSGTHGNFENPESRQRWLDRTALNQKAADELGLPMYLIDSNFHAFTHKIDEQMIGYLAIYSCVLALQKYIKRYITSSNLSYEEIAKFYKQSRDFDLAEYCESYMPHLISTECFELVIDGCQYTRAEKIERISEWELAKKYLNVCIKPVNHGHNCSDCLKCMWTLVPLEAMGKLDNFKNVFDIDVYNRRSFKWKCWYLAHYGKDSMATSIMEYCKKKGMKLPPILIAKPRTFMGRVKGKIKS